MIMFWPVSLCLRNYNSVNSHHKMILDYIPNAGPNALFPLLLKFIFHVIVHVSYNCYQTSVSTVYEPEASYISRRKVTLHAAHCFIEVNTDDVSISALILKLCNLTKAK